ncbi:hypothetical protein V500_05043 [Pseudogymnoascus sp. VKM F-4518 (FW-2643)]|nr:hypothetical protein V500_05043 [Pseudogymnoascus sp. VKM F-4518 (FW-2643)]
MYSASTVEGIELGPVRRCGAFELTSYCALKLCSFSHTLPHPTPPGPFSNQAHDPGRESAPRRDWSAQRRKEGLIAMLRPCYTVQRFEYSSAESAAPYCGLCEDRAIPRASFEGLWGRIYVPVDVPQAALHREARENSPERKRDIRAVADVDESPCTSLTTVAAHYTFDSLFSSPPPPNNSHDGFPHAPARPPGRRDGDGRFHGEQRAQDLGCGGVPDGLRDASCAAEGVLSVAVLVCMVLEVGKGVGRHSTDPIYLQNLSTIIKIGFFRGLFLVTGISLVKISVGLFLLRIVEGTVYKRIILGTIGFLVIFTLACLGTLIFQCIPVDAAWDFIQRPPPFGTGTAKCYSTPVFTAIGLFNGAVNIATDVAFALLPIPIIWKLSVNIRTKITLIFILSLGFLACVAAIMRETLLVTFFVTPDTNFENAYALWNYAELAVGIIAACLPALRPLFAFLLDKASSTFASGQVGLSTRHKYYMQSNDINLSNVGKRDDSEGARGDGRYGVSVTSNGRDFYEERMPKRPMGKLEQSLTEGEGDSDENILPIQDMDRLEGGNNRIVKTTEVRVS